VTIVGDDDQESIDRQKPYTKLVLPISIWNHYVSHGSASNQKIPEFSDSLPIIKGTTVSVDLEAESVDFSHAFCHELSDRCVNIFDFKVEDSIMHLHGSHHNGALNHVLLPSLSICKNHYGAVVNATINTSQLENIVNLVEQHGINKISMPNSQTTETFLQYAKRFTRPVGIISNQGNQPNWIGLAKEKNIDSIISSFGSMAMGGPILINKITKDSDSSHDCMNFGFPLDDFYQVELVNNSQLKTTNKYQGTGTFPDEFELTDTGYVFKHRASHLRINDVIFTMQDLNDIVNQTTNPSLVYLFPDNTLNKMYLIVDSTVDQPNDIKNKINSKLAKISPLVQIDYMDQQDVGKFKEHNQFNEFVVRNHFRIKFKLKQVL
jgi:hypothetical protein